MDKMNITSLNVYYSGAQALENVTLSVKEHQILALIGPSGCGKSTFLRCLNRMNELVEGCSTKGDVLLDQTDVQDLDVNQLRRRVGMVFQKANPFSMSIFDNVAYGPRTHGIRNRKELRVLVETALKDAGLWEEVKDRLHTSALRLSGGQQQRLCIARALAIRPEVLLMDEPTSALDPAACRRIEELCLELKKNYTIIMVTHNLQQARRIADQTAFFLSGSLVECGPTEQIFTAPVCEPTKNYVQGHFG